jgi:outer membrane lipoprotein SlyB
MKTLLMMTSLLITAALAGCATDGPETRPYTPEERFQLSMEALNRQGLSYDQYVQARAKLIRGQDANAAGIAQGLRPALPGRES